LGVPRAFGADPAQPESLRRISDGVTARMSIDPFAEGGHVLASFEPPEDINAGPAVAAALDGLDFDDYRDEEGKGLAAVQRFAGRGITAQDLDRIGAADIAFRILPSVMTRPIAAARPDRSASGPARQLYR
jgi:hypothetical protein